MIPTVLFCLLYIYCTYVLYIKYVTFVNALFGCYDIVSTLLVFTAAFPRDNGIATQIAFS